MTLAIVLAAGCDAKHVADNSHPAASMDAPAPPTSAGTPPPSESNFPEAMGSTVPVQFQGTFADAAACADAAHESHLMIEATRITFHESSGPITNVSPGSSDISITTQISGKGETREANYRFRISHDGSTLTDVGNGGARQRCG